jgi:hypothetical protein
MGYSAVPRRWGTYWSTGQVHVEALKLVDIDRFVEDLRAHFADHSEFLLIHLDLPEDKVSIGHSPSDAGCTGPTSELYLIHEGDPQSEASNHAIVLLPVSVENLPLLADTKLRAWTGTKAEPGPGELQAEVDRRQRELGGSGRGLLALVNDLAAGFIWWHDDPTRIRWISQVATRLPFRRQGLPRQC